MLLDRGIPSSAIVWWYTVVVWPMNTQIHPIIFTFYKQWFLRSAFCSQDTTIHVPFIHRKPFNETLFFLHFISLEIIWSVLSSYRTQNNTFHHVNISSMTFTLHNINFLHRTLLGPQVRRPGLAFGAFGPSTKKGLVSGTKYKQKKRLFNLCEESLPLCTRG